MLETFGKKAAYVICELTVSASGVYSAFSMAFVCC